MTVALVLSSLIGLAFAAMLRSGVATTVKDRKLVAVRVRSGRQ